MQTPSHDPVNHPSHYTFSAVQPIDAIEAWELGFHLGNAVKYIARAGRKSDRLEDLKKAAWYLQREIKRLESTTAQVETNKPEASTPITALAQLCTVTWDGNLISKGERDRLVSLGYVDRMLGFNFLTRAGVVAAEAAGILKRA